ncbi:hypothetical protein [Amorphus orientalis]|uniref:Uncharacterized protein n=1 Tax=Amorphus orientalis TaxID=649198 RepID=A0AAE3VSS2_9HYPH|nr:hypothetical protein [Amorphus orientalis]MDQ0317749.1 hypothetical protein [Amorphus orientalis]
MIKVKLSAPRAHGWFDKIVQVVGGAPSGDAKVMATSVGTFLLGKDGTWRHAADPKVTIEHFSLRGLA